MYSNFMKKMKSYLLYYVSFLFFLLSIAGCGATLDKGKNIASRRAVYQSGSADYNRTGHLVVDGIFTVNSQLGHRFKDQHGDSPSAEAPECAFDGKTSTKWLTFHNSAWLQIRFAEDKSFKVGSYSITSGNDSPERDPKEWTLEASNDGENFVLLDRREDEVFNQRRETKNFRISDPGTYKYYRLNVIKNQGDSRIQLSELNLIGEDGNTVIEQFSKHSTLDSRWLSPSDKNEWIYVDFGTKSSVEEVKLYWFDEYWAKEYDIQLSDDAKDWQTVYSQTSGKGGTESISLSGKKARYLRLFCKSANSEAFSLVEMEVFGSNTQSYKLDPLPAPLADGTQYLRGGNWRLQRTSEVSASEGAVISKLGFEVKNWLPAKVPGTVLMSYMAAGALPDPDYSDQQLMISDSYFQSDFWYRTEFNIPSSQKGKSVWLNMDAINWKAEVFLNGSYLGRIDGAFIRGLFNITDVANYGGDNCLAVLIYQNDNPGVVSVQTLESPGGNGGILGADNPTIHASIGWDWVPTIRGRNIGIYNDVYISYSGDVQMHNPWIITDLDVENKDFSKANLTVKTELTNSTAKAREVSVKGLIQPGNIPFESPKFTIHPNETREVVVSELIIDKPRLWWPVTYGEPFLYNANLEVYVDSHLSDTKNFDFGIRKYTYDTDNPMTVYCNGARIVCRGGNWGMDDSNLAATEEDYDIKVRLHAEAHLTMIRNWVGMTGNEAFYRACDKYGVLIWDDFWLANPGDGPNPNDNEMFLTNARDKVKRNRHHAAIALYCGRNEGDPPRSLNDALNDITIELDGTRYYIPHSASRNVSGWGPYSVQDSEWYFKNTGRTLHSERGMPNVPALESIKRFLPEEHQWPINPVWGLHDFTMGGAQGGRSFISKMRRYGEYNDLESFVRFAQMVNYEGHKSLFEAIYTNRANGMLMWMSQSAWPSMVWQTYDYYYDTNGGYFGIKKANQPVNAIYNFATHDIVLANTTATDRNNLQVTLNVYDVKGKNIHQESFRKSMAADASLVLTKLDMSRFNGVIFVKTSVCDETGMEIADNFTWTNATEKYNYSSLSEIPAANLSVTKKEETGHGDENAYSLLVRNEGDTPALMVRIKILSKKTNDLILPVYYSDNYFSLMPGESKTISLSFNKKLQDGSLEFYVEGWNQKTELIK